MDLQSNIEAVRAWGINKGITGEYGTGTIQRQTQKLTEEYHETLSALERLPLAKTTAETWEILDEIKDGLGDMLVVMILIGEMTGLPIEPCLDSVVKIISARTGRMVDGQFVKDK
jgi:hypothetical protein